MGNIYFDVLPTLPKQNVIKDVKFKGASCFIDWSAGITKFTQPKRTEPGYFTLFMDAFEHEYRWCHKELLTSAVRWLRERGFDARLVTTQACKRDKVILPDGLPAIAIGYKPDDMRAKIYHGLCFARYFTQEFAGYGRHPRVRSSLEYYFRWLFQREAFLDGHMPFKDRFVRGCFWRAAPVREAEPNHTYRVGAVYLSYLDKLYTDPHWEQYDDRTMSSTAKNRAKHSDIGFWTGGLTYDDWSAYYREHYINFVDELR